MSIFTKISSFVGIKRPAGKVPFPIQALSWFDKDIRLDDEEMVKAVGDGTSSDVLMTPVRWLQRAMLEADIVVTDGDDDPIKNSELIKLLENPNPYYSWEVLIAGTILSLCFDGNAYWIVAFNKMGKPVELWYAPHTNIEPYCPLADPFNFITSYEYIAQGGTQKIRPYGADDEYVDADVTEGLAVIQFREGMDLTNMRKGQSPMKGLLREIWTDNEAAAFTATLLRNNGIPGLVFSPKETGATILKEDAEALKAKIQTEFSGTRRGGVMVMLGATNVEQFGFSPKDLDLSPLRNVSEERVCAALHVQPAVIGFGAGLQQTKVGATMKELRQLSWQAGVLPLQKIISGEVSRTLAPTFNVNTFGFDNSGVEALREGQDKKAARVERLVRAAIMTRKDARDELNLETSDTDDVYLISMATVEQPRGQKMETPVEASKAIKYATEVKGQHHGLAERRIIASAPRAKPTKVVIQTARALDKVKRVAMALMAPKLERVFADLGAATYLNALDVISDFEPVPVKHNLPDPELKADLIPGDIALYQDIIEAIEPDVLAAQLALNESMAASYFEVAQLVTQTLGKTMSASFVLNDAVQQTIMQTGGLRAGLIDLSEQTKEAVFNALAEGRAKGLAGDNLARYIRDYVEAGPWRDSATRARIIARTEGAHAANISTLEAAKEMSETEHMQVFDNRIGFDDDACMAADTTIVTIPEAEAMGLAHPNCSRSFVPINSLLMEEMNL